MPVRGICPAGTSALYKLPGEEAVVLDSRWYLDINRFARSTSWAHGAMTSYFERVAYPLGVGVLVVAFLVVLSWLSARRSTEHVAAVIWAAMGAAAAYGLALVLDSALAQARPYDTVKHVEVLVARSQSYAFPDARTAVCGAVVCGLVLARRWWWLLWAVLAGLLDCFAGVYVGADYPSDVAGGAVFGAAVVLLAWPVASPVLSRLVAALAAGPLDFVIESSRPAPARRPAVAVPGGPVKLLNSKAIDALRTASEAARSQASPPHGPPLSGAGLPKVKRGKGGVPGPTAPEGGGK